MGYTPNENLLGYGCRITSKPLNRNIKVESLTIISIYLYLAQVFKILQNALDVSRYCCLQLRLDQTAVDGNVINKTAMQTQPLYLHYPAVRRRVRQAGRRREYR